MNYICSSCGSLVEHPYNNVTVLSKNRSICKRYKEYQNINGWYYFKQAISFLFFLGCLFSLSPWDFDTNIMITVIASIIIIFITINCKRNFNGYCPTCYASDCIVPINTPRGQDLYKNYYERMNKNE